MRANGVYAQVKPIYEVFSVIITYPPSAWTRPVPASPRSTSEPPRGPPSNNWFKSLSSIIVPPISDFKNYPPKCPLGGSKIKHIVIRIKYKTPRNICQDKML